MTTTRSNKQIALESRVDHLEGTMETLAQEVRTTNLNMQKISDNFSIFREDLLRRIGEITQPKWPLLLSAATLILMILGLGGTIVSLTVSGQRELIKSQEIQISKLFEVEIATKFEMAKGQIRDEQLVKEVAETRELSKTAIKELDIILQREMRLLNDTLTAKIVSVDEKIQNEFKGEMRNILETIIDIKKWRLETARIIGTIESKIEDLEKIITIIETRQHENTKAIGQLDYFRPGAGNTIVGLKLHESNQPVVPKSKAPD